MAKTTTLQDMLERTEAAGLDQMLLTQKAARTWVMKEIDKLQLKVNPQQLLDAYPMGARFRPVPGLMYMYMYDAKTKDDLPYWDRFPLIFVVDLYDDGFLGINLHYLEPKLRAQLFDALLGLAFSNKYDSTTRLRLSYEILKSAAKYKYFRPCLKRYLYSHVHSRFYVIDPQQWTLALFLPSERFVKANKNRVWEDSKVSVRTAKKKK